MKKTNNATTNNNATETKKTKKQEEKTMKKKTQEQEVKEVKIDNATKENAVYDKIYQEFKTATCKKDLVDTLNRYGIRTNTTPTTTPNKNDLYVQFYDKSRLLITNKSLKVYTNNAHAEALASNEFYFDTVQDGSYRTKRATVANTIENFKTIFTYFETAGLIEKLPAMAV